jgi:hypothetical protein
MTRVPLYLAGRDGGNTGGSELEVGPEIARRLWGRAWRASPATCTKNNPTRTRGTGKTPTSNLFTAKVPNVGSSLIMPRQRQLDSIDSV